MNALPCQHDSKPSISKTAAFSRLRLDSFTKTSVIAPNALVTNTGSIDLKNGTRPPFAHSMLFAGMRHSISLTDRRYHFFEAISFRTALSSI